MVRNYQSKPFPAFDHSRPGSPMIQQSSPGGMKGFLHYAPKTIIPEAASHKGPSPFRRGTGQGCEAPKGEGHYLPPLSRGFPVLFRSPGPRRPACLLPGCRPPFAFRRFVIAPSSLHCFHPLARSGFKRDALSFSARVWHLPTYPWSDPAW